MARLFRYAPALIVISLAATGALWLYGHFGPAQVSARSSSLDRSAPSLDEAALSSHIQSITSNYKDLEISVSVTDLQSGKTYHWGETAGYTAASLGKVITAAAYLHTVETGQAHLNDDVGDASARQQLTKLIEESDNDAWTALNETLTDGGLQSYARSIGLTNYNPQDNTMTSNDITAVLSKLYQGSLLNKADTTFLLSLLKNANMRDYIVSAVPSGTTVYHKVGYLDDRLNEAAIITRSGRSYVLAIFSKSDDSYDFSEGSQLFTAITRASLTAFFP